MDPMPQTPTPTPAPTPTPPNLPSKILLAIVLVLGGAAIGFSIAYTSFLIKEGVREPEEEATEETDDEEVLEEETDEGDEEEAAEGELDVTWLDEAVEVTPQSLGLVQSNSDSWMTLEEEFTVYRVGTIETEPFEGDDFYVIEQKCYGPCGIYHRRVIDDRDDKGLVLLKNVSNGPFDQDQGARLNWDVITNDFDIPDLHLPEVIEAWYVEGERQTLTLDAEEFSPAVMFDAYLADQTPIFSANHDTYGEIVLDNNTQSFVVEVPDHTVKLYRLRFPVELTSTDRYGAMVLKTEFDFTLNDGTVIDGSYTPVSPWICPPRHYDVVGNSAVEPIDDRFTLVKTSEDGVSLYQTVDENDTFNQEIYDAWYYGDNKPSYETFLEDYPVFFYQDELSRWFRLRDLETFPAVETECTYFDSVL